jgi:hypothetical protein
MESCLNLPTAAEFQSLADRLSTLTAEFQSFAERMQRVERRSGTRDHLLCSTYPTTAFTTWLDHDDAVEEVMEDAVDEVMEDAVDDVVDDAVDGAVDEVMEDAVDEVADDAADDAVEEHRSREKWHCATRTGKGSRQYDFCKRNNVCCIAASTKKWHDLNRPSQTPRYNSCVGQLLKFRQKAARGDVMFLHSEGLVTHCGKYTGETWSLDLDQDDGAPNSPELPTEDMKTSFSETDERPWAEEGFYFIGVEEWIPVSTPFTGAGMQQTLYEVTDKTIYVS